MGDGYHDPAGEAARLSLFKKCIPAMNMYDHEKGVRAMMDRVRESEKVEPIPDETQKALNRIEALLAYGAPKKK